MRVGVIMLDHFAEVGEIDLGEDEADELGSISSEMWGSAGRDLSGGGGTPGASPGDRAQPVGRHRSRTVRRTMARHRPMHEHGPADKLRRGRHAGARLSKTREEHEPDGLRLPKSPAEAPETVEAAKKGGFMHEGDLAGSMTRTGPGPADKLRPGRHAGAQRQILAEGTSGGNRTIAKQREQAIRELKNPATREHAARIIAKESGAGSSFTNVLESAVNRRNVNERLGHGPKTMDEIWNSGFYGPQNRGQLSAKASAWALKEYDRSVDELAGGRNVLRGRTDQGMYGMVGGKWRDEFKYKGGLTEIQHEHFGYQSEAQQRVAEQMQREAAGGETRGGLERVSRSRPGGTGGVLDTIRRGSDGSDVARGDSPYQMIGGAAERGAHQSWAGMTPDMRSRMTTMYENMPPEIRKQVRIHSGARSLATQAALFNASDRSGHSVARPSPHAPHVRGEAADLTFGSEAARQWVHANAHRFGLGFPMSYEPWHIQLR